MKRKLLFILVLILCLSAIAKDKHISNIESSKNWVYLYDERGNKIKILSKSDIGQVVGWSAYFFISKKGSWYYFFDVMGKKYKTMSPNDVGSIIAVAGENFTSRNGNWIYTWDKNGKKLKTRSAL